MSTRHAKVFGLASLVAWAVLFAYLASVYVGALYDPKALLDQSANLTPQQWSELMASPVQRAREAMIPVWRFSRYIIPALAILALGLAWQWWRVRSNSAAQSDAFRSALSAPTPSAPGRER